MGLITSICDVLLSLLALGCKAKPQPPRSPAPVAAHPRLQPLVPELQRATAGDRRYIQLHVPGCLEGSIAYSLRLTSPSTVLEAEIVLLAQSLQQRQSIKE